MEIFARNMKKEKMTLGLDIDNVTADTAGLLVEILKDRYNFKGLERGHLTRRPFHESSKFLQLGISKDRVSMILDEIWRERFQDIQLMDSRIGTINKELQRNDVLIKVITTMGARDHSIRPNLQTWLEGKGITYDGEISFVNGNAEKVSAPLHTIVDDEENLAIGLANCGRPGILFEASWNKKFVAGLDLHPNPLIHVVHDWDELGEKVLELNKAFRS